MTNARLTQSGLGLAALFVLLLPAIAESVVQAVPWYSDPAYLNRKRIVINGARVAGPLTDFPVLIRLATDSDLAADAQDDGDDILFTSSDGVTKLSHEIESFDGANGALIAWVKVPSLASPTNTILYMYYNNGAATNQQTPAGVWDANFRAVYHLKESPTGAALEMKDSTSNINHGATLGTMTAADSVAEIVAGRCLDFDGVDDSVTIPSSASLQINGPITLEAWVNLNVPRANISPFAYMVSKRTNSAAEEYVLRFGPTTPGDPNDQNEIYFATQNGASDDLFLNAVPPAATSPAQSAWSYIVATWRPLNFTTDHKRLYINGSMSLDRESVNNAIAVSTAPVRLAFGGADPLNAKMDEVRISSVDRSAEHITTSYNTIVFSHTDFSALELEEGAGTTGTATTGTATTGTATTGGALPPASDSGSDSACSCGSICLTGLETTMVGLLLAGLALLLVVRRR